MLTTANTLKEQLNIDDLSGYPGFYLADGKCGEYWSISGINDILIPFRNVRNENKGDQYQVDNPPNIVVVKEFRAGMSAKVIKQPDIVQIRFKGKEICETKLELNKETSVHKDGSISFDSND